MHVNAGHGEHLELFVVQVLGGQKAETIVNKGRTSLKITLIYNELHLYSAFQDTQSDFQSACVCGGEGGI